MFTKKVMVTGLSKYDFLNDNKEHVSGCKINISFVSRFESKLGSSISTLNFPIDKFDQFTAVQKFPVLCEVDFDVEDWNKRPIIYDIRLIKNN